jgi:hypothetical protein
LARCRAALLRAVLHHRLASGNGFAADRRYLHDFRSTAPDNWRREWPHGLKIPFANIPDRDPLSGSADSAFLDPLTRRLPEMLWTIADWTTGKLERDLVAAFGDRLIDADVERLDRFLADSPAPAARVVHDGSCTVQRNPQRGAAFDTELTCRNPDTGMAAAIALRSRGGEPVGGRIGWLETGGAMRVSGVGLVEGRRLGDGAVIDFAAGPIGNLHPRLPNGNRIERVRLVGAGPQGLADTVSVEVVEVADAAPLDAALERLAGAAPPILSDPGPMHLEGLMTMVLDELGIAHPRACCEGGPDLPAPRSDPAAVPPVTGSDALALFARHCGRCHATGADSPPSFLSGGERRVMEQLRNCGARIVFRLGMWTRNPERRPRSPMPPVPLPPHDIEDWPDSEDFARLRETARSFLAADEPGLEGKVLGTRYDSLPECRPTR